MRRIVIRQILTALFVISVIALTVNYGVLPQLNSFQEKIDLANKTDTLTSNELDELNRLKALSEKQVAIESQLQYLEDAVPLDIEISTYVDILDELAARSRVQIEFVRIGETEPYLPPTHVAEEEKVATAIELTAERINSIPVDFSVSGSYSNLINFMGELQLAPRTTLILNATLSSGANASSYSLALSTMIFSISSQSSEEPEG